MQKAVMLHFGRSGSTVLTRMLDAHPNVAWHHEYFTLLQQRTPNATIMTADQMLARIDPLLAQAGPDIKVTGYEIKLVNFLKNHKCTAEQYAQALAAQNPPARVIVLRRRNILKRILSSYRAMTTGVYHVRSDQGVNTAQFEVPLHALGDPDTGIKPTGVLDLLTLVQAREDAVIANYEKAGLNIQTLTYEDDIETDPVVGYHKLLDMFGMPQSPADIPLKKTGTALVDEITNYGALRTALAGTPYAWMV